MGQALLLDDARLVGTPFLLKAWSLTVAIECQCADRPTLLIAGHVGDQSRCACGRPYRLTGLRVLADGQLGFAIEVGAPDEVLI
jgi:hypothetical protein